MAAKKKENETDSPKDEISEVESERIKKIAEALATVADREGGIPSLEEELQTLDVFPEDAKKTEIWDKISVDIKPIDGSWDAEAKFTVPEGVTIPSNLLEALSDTTPVKYVIQEGYATREVRVVRKILDVSAEERKVNIVSKLDRVSMARLTTEEEQTLRKLVSLPSYSALSVFQILDPELTDAERQAHINIWEKLAQDEKQKDYIEPEWNTELAMKWSKDGELSKEELAELLKVITDRQNPESSDEEHLDKLAKLTGDIEGYIIDLIRTFLLDLMKKRIGDDEWVEPLKSIFCDPDMGPVKTFFTNWLMEQTGHTWSSSWTPVRNKLSNGTYAPVGYIAYAKLLVLDFFDRYSRYINMEKYELTITKAPENEQKEVASDLVRSFIQVMFSEVLRHERRVEALKLIPILRRMLDVQIVEE